VKVQSARWLGGALLLSVSLLAQGASPDEPVAALKRSLQESQTRIRKYEWIQTTAISLKGEEKSRDQKRCYYGADGKLQKLPLTAPAPKQAAPSSGGGRGGRLKERVVENKKDDMKEYMEKAVALIQTYVPPDPATIQAAKDASKMTLQVLEPGKRLRLEFKDYLQPQDLLALELDPAASRLLNLNVATFLGAPDDAVGLTVKFGALADSTSYPAEITLDAKAKNIRVVVSNSGYRPIAQ
jgi:hypothetical protein